MGKRVVGDGYKKEGREISRLTFPGHTQRCPEYGSVLLFF